MTLVVSSDFTSNLSFGSAGTLVPGWSAGLEGATFFKLFVLRVVSLEQLESLPEKIKVEIFFFENDLIYVCVYIFLFQGIIDCEDLNAGFLMKFERTTEKRTAW